MNLVILGLVSVTFRLFFSGRSSSSRTGSLENGWAIERIALDCWDEIGEG